LISKEQFTGGQPYEQILKQAREDMALSKQHAQEVALSELGLGHAEGDGARVSRAIDGTPADGVLMEGDVIVAVDGQKVRTTCDVGRLIDLHEPGDEIEVTIMRDGNRVVVTVDTINNPNSPDQPLIGIVMTDINYRFVSDVKVDIDTDQIGGPSAGLMFTLALYDRLTPDDLTDGRKIAGTGEIACDGGVGPIGGVEQKVAAAEKNGAEIFLSPSANFADAQAAADDTIEVVSVATFADALAYLEDL
jgi:PDZ domain-containing protein